MTVKKRTMRKQKLKGQVTVFIIAGILILVIVGFLYAARSSMLTISDSKRSASEVQIFIDECLYTTSEHGISILGMQAGKISPSSFFDIDGIPAGFGYYDGDKKLPSLEDMQSELESFIDGNILHCIGGLAVFEDMGYEIQEIGEPSSAVTFAEHDTIIDLNLSVSYKKKNIESSVNHLKFRTELPVSIKHIHRFSQAIVDMKSQNPGYINMSYLGSSAFDIHVLTYDDDDVQLFVIQDPQYEIFNMPYRFIFASSPVY